MILYEKGTLISSGHLVFSVKKKLFENYVLEYVAKYRDETKRLIPAKLF